MAFTPLLIDNSIGVQSKKIVDWKRELHNGSILEESSLHTVINDGSEIGSFNVSFITCSHAEGKSWESLFIPLTATGATGISITFWRRKANTKGQILVKTASETEWYQVVKSKAVDKGYDVNGFIGAMRPLSTKFSFIEDLHRSAPSLPALALTGKQVQKINDQSGTNGIGRVLCNLSNIAPISAFLGKLLGYNHDYKGNIKSVITGLPIGQQEIAQGFLERLADMKAGIISPEVAKPKEPEVAPEETYGSAWGAFS